MRCMFWDRWYRAWKCFWWPADPFGIILMRSMKILRWSMNGGILVVERGVKQNIVAIYLVICRGLTWRIKETVAFQCNTPDRSKNYDQTAKAIIADILWMHSNNFDCCYRKAHFFAKRNFRHIPKLSLTKIPKRSTTTTTLCLKKFRSKNKKPNHETTESLNINGYRANSAGGERGGSCLTRVHEKRV